jgi:hypothetical protein
MPSAPATSISEVVHTFENFEQLGPEMRRRPWVESRATTSHRPPWGSVTSTTYVEAFQSDRAVRSDPLRIDERATGPAPLDELGEWP